MSVNSRVRVTRTGEVGTVEYVSGSVAFVHLPGTFVVAFDLWELVALDR